MKQTVKDLMQQLEKMNPNETIFSLLFFIQNKMLKIQLQMK